MNKASSSAFILIGLILSTASFYDFKTLRFCFYFYCSKGQLCDVQGLTCVKGGGLSPEGSNSISYYSNNNDATCNSNDSGCFVIISLN